MAVGCSHGLKLDEDARKAVLEFKRRWKPDTVIHLGDWADTTAFRSNAKGTADEAEPILPDIDAGLQFLKEIGAGHAFLGNHEDRIWNLTHHYNAIIAHAATMTVDYIEAECAKMGASIVPYHIKTGWRRFGNFLFGHGYTCGKHYLADHAESIRHCVIAHGHRAGTAPGYRLDSTRCYGVGTLARIENMDYAKARRATLGWSAAIVWGEYTDSKTQLWLHDNRQEKLWRLPV